MRIYQKFTPLTSEEQQFATDNYWIMDWFFKITFYDVQEYYDVAAIGYLKAVKSWFSRPDLHKYKFSTIAKWAMKSYIYSEWKKEKRRIQTLSLEATIGNNNNICYMDMITYDNYSNCYVV